MTFNGDFYIVREDTECFHLKNHLSQNVFPRSAVRLACKTGFTKYSCVC